MNPRAEVWTGAGLMVVAILVQPGIALAQALGFTLTATEEKSLLALTIVGVVVGLVMAVHGFGAFHYIRSIRFRFPVYRKTKSNGAKKKPAIDRDVPYWELLESERLGRYVSNRGLFLIHTCQPSKEPGQVVDVTAGLTQHRDGPLSQGKVKSVEYAWGPKFEEHAQVITRPENGFAVRVSLYDSLLLVARVSFTDGTEPLTLMRYINFDEPSDAGPAASREAELRDLVVQRFAAIPLRGHELDALTTAVQWAVANPLEPILTGEDAIGVISKEEKGQHGQQRFHLQVPMARAYGGGWVESDLTLDTLNDCLRTLTRLINEVRHDEAYWLGRSDHRRY